MVEDSAQWESDDGSLLVADGVSENVEVDV